MSKPWIVHQYGLSPNVERLKRALIRLELPFEDEDYMPFDAAGRAKVAAFVEQAGHNQMPVLERDDLYYGDSLKIIHMLMAEYPDRAVRLYPADPIKAAVVHAFVLAGDNGFLRPEGKFLTDAYKQQKGEAHAAKITAIGNERDRVYVSSSARVHTFSAATNRVYTIGDFSYPDELMFEFVDPATGAIGARRDQSVAS